MVTILLLKPKLEVVTLWETILMQDGSPEGPVHQGLHMVGFYMSDMYHEPDKKFPILNHH